MNLAALSAEFPREVVHWRSQTLTRNGEKAMALAYIDARDVMNRLDEAVGPDNWQDEYTSAGGRTICRIGIRIGDEWVWKSDGAGDTDIEGQKGGISDAFKRAAVKWGIGRYLYGLPTPWVPCATYDRNGKAVFKEFTDDPWSYVRGRSEAPKTPVQDAPAPDVPADPPFDPEACFTRIKEGIEQVVNGKALDTFLRGEKPNIERLSPEKFDTLKSLAEKRRGELERKAE